MLNLPNLFVLKRLMLLSFRPSALLCSKISCTISCPVMSAISQVLASCYFIRCNLVNHFYVMHFHVRHFHCSLMV